MPDIISLGQKAQDARFISPEECLKDSLSMLGKDGAFKNAKKLIVLALDDTEENFSVSFNQAGMSMSECISVCEVAKTIFLEQMGYINPE